MRLTLVILFAFVPAIICLGAGKESGRTTLTNPGVRYEVAKKAYVVLKRGDVEAVIVDHRAVDDDVLPKHRAGYSGLASLTHAKRRANVFVPSYAGLNFEHIHDGTTQPRDVLFEPRRFPMELRIIDPFTAELYQAPTGNWKLESCSRYELLLDGSLEMTFECVPRAKTFRNDYIGLFWASYLHQPKSLDVHFQGLGQDDDSQAKTRWIQGTTPSHGDLSTHLGIDDRREFAHDEDFPLTLVFNRSRHRFARPWYYGISGDMALVQVFRDRDRIRMSQSPSGGGKGNPAWDFQFFIPQYEVGKRYGFTMRMLYLPFESPAQIQRTAEKSQRELEPPPAGK
ncbi:MAG: hypothetical protein N2C14_05435 [Planctomycetales bacterium]